MRVVVVGAGLAGSVAGRTLAGAGHEVVLVDKGRSPGGRMATRRIGGARLDHGAQFFTARSEVFQAEVNTWLADGRAIVWANGFGAAPDGHPRHVGAAGMNALARSLCADLDVRCGVQVTAVGPGGGAWRVDDLVADAVIVTTPVPQALAVLDAGGAPVADGDRSDLDAIGYDMTVAALVTLDGPSAVPAPGGLQLTDGPFSFVGDNVAKGISEAAAVTFHVNPSLSEELFETDPDDALRRLLVEAAPYLGGASVQVAELKRWRYSRPTTTHPSPCLEVAPGLVLAGDAFAGAKVEGAYLSGLAAAALLVDR